MNGNFIKQTGPYYEWAAPQGDYNSACDAYTAAYRRAKKERKQSVNLVLGAAGIIMAAVFYGFLALIGKM